LLDLLARGNVVDGMAAGPVEEATVLDEQAVRCVGAAPGEVLELSVCE
jgi:hypothetical protein